MKYQLKNNFLTATVTDRGAELLSAKGNYSGYEYIWQANSTSWRYHAPILFPFVGKLKNDRYSFAGKTYHMPQHGFARNSRFRLLAREKTSITFLLTDTVMTRKIYPFAFSLEVSYTLLNNLLEVNCSVLNRDQREMIFALGGHPGFNVPVTADVSKEDFYLDFHPSKARVRVPYRGKFLDWDARYLASTNSPLGLRDSLFKNDALLYQMRGNDNKLSMRTDSSDFHINVWTRNAPFMSIWSPYPKAADFVCVASLWGIADTVDATGRLEQKRGMNRLAPGRRFSASFAISFHS